MVKRVLIIGGYGNFGSYIASALADDANIQLLIGGRSAAKAQAFVAELTGAPHVRNVKTSLTLRNSKDAAMVPMEMKAPE